MPTFLRLLLMILFTLLAACGGDGGSGSEPASNGGTTTPTPSEAGDPLAYFPLAEGNRWVYDVTHVPPLGPVATSSEMVTISGTQTVAGTQVTVEQRRNVASNALLEERQLLKSATGLLQYYTAGTAPYDQADGFLTLLQLPLQAGATYQQLDRSGLDWGADVDGDGLHESLAVTTTVSINGPFSLTVPVGSFSNALKVTVVTQERVTQSLSGVTDTMNTTTWEHWLVPGLGALKHVRTVIDPWSTDVTTWELASYRVDGTRSESTPPAVVQSLPASTGVALTKTGVHLELDEPLDPDLVNNQSLTLVDSGGQAVSGTVSVSGQTLTFVPAQPLDGSYTATASNLADLLGNVLASHAWTFTMSSTPPTVTAMLPAAATTHVLTRDSIVITFSEAMDANSFTATSATLTGGPANTLAATVSGNQVTLKPVTRLAYGTPYTVTLTTAIKDVQGDALSANYSFSFTTYPHRLQPAVVQALGSRPYALAIDDVNGDGRKDVLVATWYAGSTENDFKLFLYYQQANGTLAAPLKITTASSYTCPIESLATGDVTGDGKRDIVLGEFGCGHEILQRGGDGSWSSGGRVSTPYNGQTRVADLNNDARLDVVGVADTGAAVWYQQAGGGLGSAATYPLSASGIIDLDPADLNGDGLIDIAALNFGNNTKALVTLTQAASGGFDAATYAGPTGVYSPIRALATGDINHDGRQDALLSLSANSPNSQIGIFYQQADGSMGPLTPVATYDLPCALEVADLDKDGRNDVVVLHQTGSSVGVHRQLDDGTLQGEELFSAPTQTVRSQGMAVGDINGDGYPDVVVGDEISGLVILYNLGT